MSNFKRMLAMLLAVVMVICALPMAVAAADGDGDSGVISKGGIVTSKTYDEATGMLTLEAYVTGKSQTITKSEPIDVVLVLDVSGSMDDPINGYTYSETYDVNKDGEYYYKDEYGYFQRAYYCGRKRENNKGWYTEQHFTFFFVFHFSPGVKLTPKTSANSSGTQFYTRKISSTEDKIDALKDSAKNFVDLVAKNSQDGAGSNIAIVKFAGDKKAEIGNNRYNGDVYNYSQIVMDLTSAKTDADKIKSAIDSLVPGGATRADYGMQHAESILSKTQTGNKKVVILFTDGEPTANDSFENSVANNTIAASSRLKNNGAIVYTIGCFGEANDSEIPEDGWDADEFLNLDKYMNLVSSNCSSAAKDMDAPYSTYTYGKYYKNASSTEKLDEIFERISTEIGGATTTTLKSTTVMQDVVSKHFYIPADATVRAHTETCTAIDAEGKPTEWSNDNNYDSLSVKIDGKDGKTVTVTGFDYTENWVGSHDGEPGGKKLVLEIAIKPNDDAVGTVPTNDREKSGLYVNGEKVADFAKPEVTFPFYTVKHIQNGAEVEGLTKKYPVTEKASLTDLVPEGYLYGGTFTGNDKDGYTTPYSFDAGESGLSFTPKAGETYCIWEVSDQYLMPKSLSLSVKVKDPDDGVMKDSVNGFYLMTAIDRAYYKKVGFDVTDKANNEVIVSDVGSAGPGETGLSNGGNVYSEIHVKLKNGNTDVYTLEKPPFNIASGGYIACHEVPQSCWTNVGDTTTFIPYWVTLDGVKVTGSAVRTCEYKGLGYYMVERINEEGIKSTATMYNEPITTMMKTVSLFTLNNDEEVTEPSIPVEPIEPVEPITKPDPIVIIPTKKNYTVTVVDGDIEYEIKVAKNDGITLDPMGSDGKLFAGWYVGNKPADLTKITDDIEVCAKYVNDDYLCTKYIEQGLFRVYGMTLISALDSDNYNEAGFVINGEVHSCNFSESYGTFTARALFGSGVDRGSKLMTYSLSLRNASNGDKFEVTPYWVTCDGTTVYGTTRTFTYNSRGIIG